MTQGGLARLKALEWRLKYFLCIRQRSCPVELYRLSWPCHGTPLVTSPGDWCLAINLLSHHPPINVLSQSLATCPVWTWPGLLCAAGPAGPPVRPATLQGRKVAGGKMWREERRWSGAWHCLVLASAQSARLAQSVVKRELVPSPGAQSCSNQQIYHQYTALPLSLLLPPLTRMRLFVWNV